MDFEKFEISDPQPQKPSKFETKVKSFQGLRPQSISLQPNYHIKFLEYTPNREEKQICFFRNINFCGS